MDRFLESEQNRWTYKQGNSGVSVHRSFCLNCKTELRDQRMVTMLCIKNEKMDYILCHHCAAFHAAKGTKGTIQQKVLGKITFHTFY